MTIKPFMKAAVLDEPFSLNIQNVPTPSPGPEDVLISVECVGICGSDIHYYEYGKIGRYKVKDPIILGHEVAGDITAVGENVDDFSIGDRVAVEPGVTCGRCEYCKSGRYNLCPYVHFMATPPIDGAWCEYVVSRRDFIYKLPDNISYEEGALLEPFSVGLHAIKRGRGKPNDKILIQGMGPVGLLTIQAAKLFGIQEIYVSDMIDSRLQKAMELGATGTINTSISGTQGENVEEKLNNKSFDMVIETSGNAKAVSNTINLVRRGGKIVFVGLPIEDEIPMDMTSLTDAELDVFGVFRYANTYPMAIKLITNSNLDIRQIITDSFALEDISEALERNRLYKHKTIKTMIYPNDSK